MDGFNSKESVIVIGATNRNENLDEALKRPGRFDIQVSINLPDFTGRQELVTLYLEKLKSTCIIGSIYIYHYTYNTMTWDIRYSKNIHSGFFVGFVLIGKPILITYRNFLKSAWL